ncbi:MAG: choice-of-anchor H family protein [Gammaproteobacteria bacterium]
MTHNNARRADRRFKLDLIAVAAALVLLGVASGASAQDAAATAAPAATKNTADGAAVGPVRRSFSAEGFKNRGAKTLGKSKARNLPTSKARSAAPRNADTGFGVFDGFAEIYFDDDADGFFYGLDVFFDVDTDFDSAFVYAALYLSLNGGPWELYYTTDDFEINGAIADDEYVVETELFDGYPTDFYDVLVEIYDADFGDFVAEFGPADSSALAVLPLEDQLRDTPVAVGGGFLAVNNGGGGALGGSLIALGLLAFARRRFPS